MTARLFMPLLFVLPAFAQTSPTPEVGPLPQDLAIKLRPVMEAIFRLDYVAAEQLCERLIQEKPENPAGYVYRARVYWSEALSRARLLSVERMSSMDLFSDSPRFRSTVERDTAERFHRASEDAIARARKWLQERPGDPTAQFLLGAAYQSLAGYQFSIEGLRWPAAKNSNASYDLNRKLVRSYPQFADARVVTGVVSAINASLTFKLKLFEFVLGYYGNWNEGQRDLEIAVDHAAIAADDARTLLAIMYVRDGQFGKAIATLQELRRLYPGNYLVHLDIAAAYLLLNRPKEAIETYSQILDLHYAGLDRAAVLNRLGVAERISGNLTASETWLRRAADGSNSVTHASTIAHLELGKTLDLQGKHNDAVKQYNYVLTANDFLESHKEARDLIRKPYSGLDDAATAGGLLTLR